MRMSYGNVSMSSGWHTLPFVSHPGVEVVEGTFYRHDIAKCFSFYIAIQCMYLFMNFPICLLFYLPYTEMYMAIYFSRKMSLSAFIAMSISPQGGRGEIDMAMKLDKWAVLPQTPHLPNEWSRLTLVHCARASSLNALEDTKDFSGAAWASVKNCQCSTS